MKKALLAMLAVCTLAVSAGGITACSSKQPPDSSTGSEQEKTVDVKFVVDDNVIETKRVIHGGSLSSENFPSVPAKEGYTGAWNSDSLSDITSETTIVATYTAKTYTAKFDYDGANGGNSETETTFTYGEAAGELPVPTKTGYTFDGWTVNGEKISADTVWNLDSTEEITIVATFTAKTYIAKFDYNGSDGENSTTETTFTFGEAAGELPVPIKTGHTFDGWTVNGEKIAADTVWNLDSTEEITIVATYTAKTYTVKFDYDGANGGNSETETTFTFGEAAGELPVPTKTGYTFDGWTVNGEAITADTVWNLDGAEEITLVATYKAKTYTVKFDYNGANGGNSTTEATFTFGEAVGSLPVPRKTGYTFDGWTVNGEKVDKDSAWKFDSAEEITLVATYTVNTSVLKFNYNGAESGNEIEKKTITYGEAVGTLPAPTKTGYTFDGWMPRNGSFKITETTVWNYEDVEELEVFARFTAKKCTLKFNYNGADGGNNTKSTTVTYDANVGWLPAPTKTGYTFDYWTLNGEEIRGNSVWKIDTTEEMTIDAHYTANTYTVKFDYNGADGENTTTEATLTYGEAVGELPAPKKAGYTFLGWAVNDTTINDKDTVWKFDSTGEITLVARWERTASEGLLFEKNYNGSAYYVTGIGSCTDYDLVIPSMHDGLPVTSIAESAFNGCKNIVFATIPESVTWINTWAFANCTNLVRLTLLGENTRKSIGYWAFSGCYKLVAIENHGKSLISSDSGNATDYAKVIRADLGANDVKNQDGYLFFTYNSTNYLLGYIGTEQSLVLPENYGGEDYEIYQYAFYERSDLFSVTIPEKVTKIGSDAFRDCYKLYEVINKSALSIKKGGYDNGNVGCYALTVHDGGSVIVRSGDYLFLTLSDSYGKQNYLLGYVGTGTDVELPQAYNEERYIIAEYAFYEENRLKKDLIIPESATIIREYAFFNASIVTVTINKGSIEAYAFNSCSELISVTIGSGVTAVGGSKGNSSNSDSAFPGCSKLIEIVNNSNRTIGYTNHNGNGYYSKTIHEGTSWIVEADGFRFITASGVNYLLGYYGTASSIVLPEKYNGEDYEIYTRAFYQNKALTSVTLGDGVTRIGDYAFRDCTGLTSLSLGSGVTRIGEQAFYGCTGLTSVTIPASVEKIYCQAFAGCTSLTSMTFEKGESWIAYSGGTYISFAVTDPTANANYWKEGLKRDGITYGIYAFDYWYPNA